MVRSSETDAQRITKLLGKLRGIISVTNVDIREGMIENIDIMTSIRRLQAADAQGLFHFYFHELSAEAREFFPPYPLFSPEPASAEELGRRITDWGKEDDWTVMNLTKDDRIKGMGLLKRYRTERPTSGLAVSEQFQNKGLGVLIQTLINEQARLLGLKAVWATAAPENTTSIRVHEKCGFIKTSEMKSHFIYKNGAKVVDRQDVEMVLKLSENRTV
jgi:RimJ/RimL family protein N-acetyltransferase